MNKARLVACPACTRHVRVSEAACPFCGVALPEDFGAGPAPRKPAVRLSRAAIYALGATSFSLVTATVACGSSGNGGGDAGEDHMAVAAYGCPEPECGHVPDGGGPPETGGPSDGGTPEAAMAPDGSAGEGGDTGVVAAYGAPGDAAAVDVGSPADAGPADADAGFVAAYGLPPGDH